MYIENRITIHAPLEVVFAASADIEAWPRILPHYRYVRRQIRPDGNEVFAMSAWRNLWPTFWTSTQQIIPPDQPGGPLVRYRHVAGVTRGMYVEWRFTTSADGVAVCIAHDFLPDRAVVRLAPVQFIVLHAFVANIADKTLLGVKRYTEGQ